MSQDYFWSPATKSFYPATLRLIYEAAGTFPADAVLVDNAVFDEFGMASAAEGMTRGVDSNGMPAWAALTTAL